MSSQSRINPLEDHVALFGIFDSDEMSRAIEAAIEKQNIPEMSKKAMSKKERDELPDSAFGLPKLRKYPMTDPDRVKNAIKYFKFCSKENRKELAENIKKAVKKFHIEVVVTRGNPIIEYMPNVKVVAPERKKSQPEKK